jgi:hypothetical protein
MFRSFSRRSAGAVLALGLVFALPVGAEDTRPQQLPYDAPGGLPQLDPNYRKTSHKVVLITDQALNPRLVTLEEGQLVAWISYSKVASQIVFEREVAKHMICHSLVNFSLKEDELRSAMIHPGEFASFCELKPGRYKYKIIRNHSDTPGIDVAKRRLEGEIIVGNPS